MNPKDRVGRNKPPLSLVPGSALVLVSSALRNGADKYGPYNWRDQKIQASNYISAALRHLLAWNDGEDTADDSGLSHLAHACAGLMILIDSIETGNAIDDRPKPGVTHRTIKQNTRHS